MKTMLILLLASTTSCATVMTGHTDYIELRSNPSGAEFRTNRGGEGVTPGGILVDEKEDLIITFSKEGYEDTVIAMPSHISKWVWGNLLFGGIFGLIVDYASDGMETHEDSAFANLKQV
ncbi:MAG: hypothetical protein ACI84O_000812 [Myxococcota bacterium]|jgi:hypothetical protein